MEKKEEKNNENLESNLLDDALDNFEDENKINVTHDDKEDGNFHCFCLILLNIQ